MKIAVMGGTFNPIHKGHLISAETVAAKLGFDRVLFVPSAQPPHKSPSYLADAEHRYAMVGLAIQGNPHFEASRIEVDRPGPSYAIDTIRELQREYGQDAELFWIIGADMLIEFRIWKDFDTLLDICQFVATTRPGYKLAGVPRVLKDRVRLVTIPDVDISSTDIRLRIRQHRAVQDLIPRDVIAYIYDHRLYGAGEAPSEEDR